MTYFIYKIHQIFTAKGHQPKHEEHTYEESKWFKFKIYSVTPHTFSILPKRLLEQHEKLHVGVQVAGLQFQFHSHQTRTEAIMQLLVISAGSWQN